MDTLFITGNSFLELFGRNPYAGMWFLFVHGGWIVILILILWGAKEVWVDHLIGKALMSKEWVLLAIDVPRLTEQTPRAVENIFAFFAGIHAPPANKLETYVTGHKQGTISCEIISIEGRVQFLIHAERKHRDSVEAAIYSQYPDAEIVEVEDYSLTIPSRYPDKEWDLFGTEMIPVRDDVFPIRTYPEFEDKVSGEFKDPMSVLLESMSRLGPGEQFWYQIVLTPIAQVEFSKKAGNWVKKFTGQVVESKPTFVEAMVTWPFRQLALILEVLGLYAVEKPTTDKEGLQRRMMSMTPGEKKIVEAVEHKASKVTFLCKIRFIYAAKHEVMKKSRIVHPFIGAIKQYNTNDMQALKPSGKVGMSSTIILRKNTRNTERKNTLLSAYRGRSDWAGHMPFHMNSEELASLWHFPITGQVKSPQLQKTESKRAEPPINLPYA
ncbi:MAG: hypothetical protein NUV81_02120 [bacterium]|nr:hypothetical protein [bacterium]